MRTLYVGVTNNLERRVAEHRMGKGSVFTAKYRVHHLIYFEQFSSIIDAIRREKQIKGWTRIRKLELIQKINPRCLPLFERLEYPLPADVPPGSGEALSREVLRPAASG